MDIVVTTWIVGIILTVIAMPWLVFGVSVVYFKLLRNGTAMALFDWPFLLTLIVSGALINITTLAIVSLVQRVIGIELLPMPPEWRPVKRPGGTA